MNTSRSFLLKIYRNTSNGATDQKLTILIIALKTTPGYFILKVLLLAHLWGAYAIPVALSGVRLVSYVSTITTRNNKDIKSIFGAIVHHVPGLCLLGIGGAPYISHKIMAQKPNFNIFRLLL